MKIIRKSFYLNLFIITISCNNINTDSVQSMNNNKLESEDFDSFYLKFHRDTLFQISRIIFPLEGYNLDSENALDTNSNFRWNRNEWTYHKLIELDSQFKREFKIIGDSAKERIYIPNSGLETIRKFSKKDGKWHLVFYGNQDL